MSGMCSVSDARRVRGIELMWTRLPGIGEADWEFKTTFDVSEDELNAPLADLVFEGLDTFATVTLVKSPLCIVRARVTDTDANRTAKNS